MALKVTAYTITASIEHKGITLEIKYKTGIIVPGGTVSVIYITLYQKEGRVKCHPPPIETPTTKERLQPIRGALEQMTEESAAQVLFDRLIVTLRELDMWVTTIRPNIFSNEA